MNLRINFDRVQSKHKELRKAVLEFGREVQEIDQLYRSNKTLYPKVLGTFLQGYLRLVKVLIHVSDRSQTLGPQVTSILDTMDREAKVKKSKDKNRLSSNETSFESPLEALGFSMDEDTLRWLPSSLKSSFPFLRHRNQLPKRFTLRVQHPSKRFCPAGKL